MNAIDWEDPEAIEELKRYAEYVGQRTPKAVQLAMIARIEYLTEQLAEARNIAERHKSEGFLPWDEER